MVVVNTSALYSDLLEDLGSDRSQDPVTVRAKDALKLSFLKKFKENVAEDADARAIAKFVAANERCSKWVRRRSGFWDDELIGHFKEEVHLFFNPRNRYPLFSTHGEILLHGRTGPGAAIGARGNDFYTKLFASDLSCTSTFLEVLYTDFVQKFPTWAEAERHRIQSGYSFPKVTGSRMSCVPKNRDISRVICIEPSLNMFYQLGVGAIMERRLEKHFGINLSTQPDVNRELARIGSLNDDLCTIDLESASDSISMKMLEATFPRDIVAWLRRLRSPFVDISNERHELFMVSSMGNGFTFPLQTIIFSCVIAAVKSFFRIPRTRSGKDWSVFGDDIIVRREIVGPVMHLLDLLGFTVNSDKSFLQGPFRESCGYDFFQGRNVRGVYLKTLRTQQDLCVAINLLNIWSSRHGVYLPRTVKHLASRCRFIPVPARENDDAGIKVPFLLLKNWRFSKKYQSIMYRRYLSKPKVLREVSGTMIGPRGVKRRIYNPAGLLLAFVNNTLENGEIHIRHGVNTYQLRTGIAPYWDSIPTTPSFDGVSFRQWKIATCVNLT